MKPKLTGDRCLCRACGLHFKSSSGFAAHRYGDFTQIPPYYGRACRTPDELRARGFEPNAAGFWRIPRVVTSDQPVQP